MPRRIANLRPVPTLEEFDFAAMHAESRREKLVAAHAAVAHLTAEEWDMVRLHRKSSAEEFAKVAGASAERHRDALARTYAESRGRNDSKSEDAA
jgi:hypothetical protein